MRLSLIWITLAIAACGPARAPSAADPTKEPWYAKAVQELAAIDRDAETAYQNGEPDQAAALIEKGEPIEKKIVSVAQPTLAAAEAASDLDDLYGRMLLANRHYGWARLEFQKNLARWKHWPQQTEESQRRYRQAASEIEECDRRMEQ